MVKTEAPGFVKHMNFFAGGRVLIFLPSFTDKQNGYIMPTKVLEEYFMFPFNKKKKVGKPKIDRKILRKNDISLLILDERWNNLFANTEKTPEIMALEDRIKELLKEQARLITESKNISATKKMLMDRIIKLTPEAFEKNSEEARTQMQQYEKEIRRINERLPKIEEELDNIPESIKNTNLELLEHMVNMVYFKIRANRKRKEELDRLIEETRIRLKEYIDEKESLVEDDTGVYSYFHDLLGAEELERLDKEYFES